jgi:hypothetical protein
MTDNIIEKGKAPDKAAEDTVMTTKPMPTEEGAREPSKRWKKSQAYFERSRALAREKYRKRQERRPLRKVGIEVVSSPLHLQCGIGLRRFGYIASPRT